MKRVDLIKTIEGFGCVLIRHGAKHDWYRNANTGVSQPIPRHREIKENLARHMRTTTPETTRGEVTGQYTVDAPALLMKPTWLIERGGFRDQQADFKSEVERQGMMRAEVEYRPGKQPPADILGASSLADDACVERE